MSRRSRLFLITLGTCAVTAPMAASATITCTFVHQQWKAGCRTTTYSCIHTRADGRVHHIPKITRTCPKDWGLNLSPYYLPPRSAR